MSAAPFAYFGIACGCASALCLVLGLLKARRELREEDRYTEMRAAAEEGEAYARTLLAPTPPTELEDREVLVEAEAACREAALR